MSADSPAGLARFPDVFAALERGALGADEVRRAFEAILGGAWTPVQIGAFAAGLRLRGETAEAIGAAAEALRAVMTGVDHGLPAVLDTCGTGGDGAHTLNVSTAAAIVVAAAGVPVAKHGNRSVSSRCGSADVVAALGVPIDLLPSRQGEVLREAGIAFLLAPAHHPALRHAASARRELGVRTIFNALGPLVNPARTTHQLVGVYDDALRPVMAHALARLGVSAAWVVRSEDGLDEVSPAAPTRVSMLAHGRVDERVVQPADFGIAEVPLEDLRGGDAADNADAIERALAGELPGFARAVALNAAAALAVARGATSARELREAGAAALDAIGSGRALETLARWRDVAQRLHAGAETEKE
jgi:anthranilate phosphoribosyltransferase